MKRGVKWQISHTYLCSRVLFREKSISKGRKITKFALPFVLVCSRKESEWREIRVCFKKESEWKEMQISYAFFPIISLKMWVCKGKQVGRENWINLKNIANIHLKLKLLLFFKCKDNLVSNNYIYAFFPIP